jgi:tuberous sclerosis protein 2
MPQTKQEKPLGERVKAFFKTRSTSKSEISAESLLKISAEQPVSLRIQAIKELQGLVKEKKIQQNCVEQLWIKVSDLLDHTTEETPQQEVHTNGTEAGGTNNGTGSRSQNGGHSEEQGTGTHAQVDTDTSREARHAVLDFLVDLVTTQYSSLDVMRLQFFGLLKKHTVAEDVKHRILLLDALTQHGTNVQHFQDEIGPLLVDMLRQSTEQLADCTLILALTANLISHDAAPLSPEVVMHLIGILSSHACNTKSDVEVQYILDIYKNMVQHTTIPSEAILQFTACLCRVVNIEQVRLDALITMRSLLGTGMGQSSLGDLCSLIQSSPDQQEDELLIRGAVFFIGSCLWGPHSVPSLKYSSSAILPVFLVALKDGQPQVVVEASAQILSLVHLQGTDLSGEAWKQVFSVVRAVHSGLNTCQEAEIKLEGENNVKETIETIDELITKKKFTGRLF